VFDQNALNEGWYLMTPAEVERLVSAIRDGSGETEFGRALSVEEAIAYRNAGNLPDEHGRTLRLILYDDGDPGTLAEKRLRFEPDYHEAPTWKTKGSRAVNLIPLRTSDRRSRAWEAWWEEPAIARLEQEWMKSGSIEGLRVPAEYRGFVFKTVVALRSAGKDVTPQTVADSVARWVPAADAERIRKALVTANQE
jgi:hypothetical protein